MLPLLHPFKAKFPILPLPRHLWLLPWTAIIFLFGQAAAQPLFPAPPFQWLQQAGAAGNANDLGYDLALDGATALFVCGSFECCASFGATNVTTPAGSGVFLARYLASGTFDWVRTATSASGGGNGYAVSSDPLGNCYLTGSFLGTTSFGSSNVTSAGGSDVFVAKYDRSGQLLWVVRQGGGFDDSGRGIAADGTNGCFVTGLLQSSSSAASRDIFVAKYNAFGEVKWQRQPVGSSSDAGMAATSDQNGNAFITGWFTGTVNFGSTNLTALGARDIFIAKYNNAGVAQWVSSTGGANGDEGKGVGVDTNGNVYCTGSFNIGGGGANNAQNLLLTKFDNAGALVWQRELLANFNYINFSSATDPAGNTWVVGGFPGTGTLSGVTITSAGGYDSVVAKYNSAGMLVWISQAGGLGSTVGHHVVVDAGGHCYFTGDFDGNAVFGGTNFTSYGGTDIFIGRLGSEISTPLRLVLSVTNAMAALDFFGAPGSLVPLESSKTLSGGWVGLTDFAMPADVFRWVDSASPTDAQRFYRVAVVP